MRNLSGFAFMVLAMGLVHVAVAASDIFVFMLALPMAFCAIVASVFI